jgi:hypothetical protein
VSNPADLEFALLVLHNNVFRLTRPDEGMQFGLEQLDAEGLRGRVEEATVSASLQGAVEFVRSPRPIDRFGAAQAFVLGVVISRYEGRVAAMRDLAEAHVAQFSPTDTSDAAQHLLNAVAQLVPLGATPMGEPRPGLPANALHELSFAFDTALQVTGDLASGHVEFIGPAAPLATMMIELAATWNTCRAEFPRLDADGREVTRVEIDVCTNLSFARCSHGVDPLNWPECNPFFFQSVVPVGPPKRSPNGDGWAGVIKERVGPSLNKGQVYETNLVVRMVEESDLAAVTFDLAPNPVGDVTVDRGFVSVTEEGQHRRMRVLKVYRIENFPDVPQSWICPLWVWQVALAGWWCA